jgi:predicted PurR-regulated permease PerM
MMITSKTIAHGILRAIGVLLLLALGVYFIYQIQTVIVYLLLSLLLALIANPIVEFLKRKAKFKNTMAVATTLAIFLLVLIGLAALFVPLIIDQGNKLSLLNAQAIETRSLELYRQLDQYLNTHNMDMDRLLKETDLTSKIKFNSITDFLNALINTISSIGIGIVSVFFITFFLLKDKIAFLALAKRILPDTHEDQILNSIDKIRELLSRYFIGLIIQLSIVCVLYLIVLLIFGVDNAFIIAFLCALLNIIPYVGPLIGTAVAGILTMLSFINADFSVVTLPTTLYVLIGFTLVQFIDNNITSPIIFSKSVNSHPLEIFLVVLVAGMLFGITGMIIAVPAFTILKVIAKEFYPKTTWIQLLTKNL